jgi:hypothetical protein
MSESNEVTNLEINTVDNNKILSFQEIISLINDKYFLFLNNLLEKFKYHDELIGQLEFDLKFMKDRLEDNNNLIIETITNNLLYCLEQISDHNTDYFIYQKEKVTKKNGKFFKNKLPKIGNKVLLKKILKESEKKNINSIFNDILDFFNLLVTKDENDIFIFNPEYVSYVKENFTENKNFGKMIIVINNIDNILNNKLDEEVLKIEEYTEPSKEDTKNKDKKNKKNKSKNNDIGMDFMKGLEGTKIAQLAKNISDKIKMKKMNFFTLNCLFLFSFFFFFLCCFCVFFFVLVPPPTSTFSFCSIAS